MYGCGRFLAKGGGPALALDHRRWRSLLDQRASRLARGSTSEGRQTASVSDLEPILRDLRELVARPDNDFTYSWWDDTAGVVREVDELTAAWRRTGEVPAGLPGLFLPTGGLQELAISSGWGEEFNQLTDRFERSRDYALSFSTK